jgi:tetratricopeptide (TPR) repeat protein
MMGLAYFLRRRARPVIQQADAARDRREWAIAAGFYSRALGIVPERNDIWVQYGNMLKESGAREEAAKAYSKALAIDPTVTDTHLQIGHLRKLQGDSEAAAESYTRALELDHGSQAAVELTSMGREADARRILARPAPEGRTDAGRIAELEVQVSAIAAQVSNVLDSFLEHVSTTSAIAVQISTFLEHVSTTRTLALELSRLKTTVAENGDRFARFDRALDAIEATLRRHGVTMTEISARQAHDAEASARVEMRLTQQSEALGDVAGALAHQTAALAKVGARLEQKSEALADISARSRSL